jgi:antitoxin MazE
MKASIVSIGNSKGIRIPKPMLKECEIDTEVELTLEDKTIVLKPVKSRPREGWEEAFRLMHKRRDDALLIEDRLDLKEWEWK